MRLSIGLSLGSRISAANPFTKQHKLQGTELLLTQAGRQTLADFYCQAFSNGASAVCTSVDTSHAHLDAVEFFEDYSLPNDLSYYIVGKAKEQKLQGNGYKHCIPRNGVSVGERRNFAGLLAQLAVEAAIEGRALAEQRGKPKGGLVGATINFSSVEDPHLGSRMEYQMKRACAADFFAIDGCSSVADVQHVAELLETNAFSVERRYRANLKGMMALEDEATAAGFDVPALVLTSVRPCTAEFETVLAAAAHAPRIGGLAVPTVTSDQEMVLLERVANDSFVYAGPSEAAGELAVLSGAALST